MTKALFPNADYRMKATRRYLLFFIFLLSPQIIMIGAQSTTSNNDNYSYGSFSPSIAVIIVVLIASIFFIVFFSIYLRHCSDDSSTVRQALSMRARRAVAEARGLDASVIATFPTLSYSEVKDHKLGKDALECAVCLNEFEEDETLRLIPKCDHVFHPECIDMWLESHVTCPVCRANLAPQTGDDDSVREDSGQSNSEEIVIQVDGDGNNDENRNLSFEPRSWSIRRPVKFRSHSTGHSLVQPGENLDRFTLRLPADMRKEVLSRVTSCSTSLPREGSSRKGYRTGAGELQGRFYQRIEIPDRGVKSDRWGIFTRGLSMRLRSPKVAADGGEGSTPKRRGNRTPPSKLPSFKCLEPKANDGDETRLFSDDSAGQSQV